MLGQTTKEKIWKTYKSCLEKLKSNNLSMKTPEDDRRCDDVELSTNLSTFGYDFQNLLKTFISLHQSSDALSSEDWNQDPEKIAEKRYSIKRIIVVLGNKKGDVRRTIIAHKETTE